MRKALIGLYRRLTKRVYWCVMYDSFPVQYIGSEWANFYGGCPDTGLFVTRAEAECYQIRCDMGGKCPLETRVVSVPYNHPLVAKSLWRIE